MAEQPFTEDDDARAALTDWASQYAAAAQSESDEQFDERVRTFLASGVVVPSRTHVSRQAVRDVMDDVQDGTRRDAGATAFDLLKLALDKLLTGDPS